MTGGDAEAVGRRGETPPPCGHEGQLEEARREIARLAQERRDLEAGLRASVQVEWRVIYDDQCGRLVVWSTTGSSKKCRLDLVEAQRGGWSNARAQMRALWTSGWVDLAPEEGGGPGGG